MSTQIEIQARLAADRVDAAAGIPKEKSESILLFILPVLLKCLTDEFSDTTVQEMHDDNPGKLRRRTMHAIRGESVEKMTRDEAFALADAAIAQALAVEPEVAIACFAEVSG